MVKTSLGEIPMSQNPFWAIFHVVEIWLADRYGALKSDWLNSQMVKTSLGEIPMSQNFFRAIFHVPQIWLVDRYGALKPDWLNSQSVKTPLGEFPIFDNLWSDDVENVIHLGNRFHKNSMFFWPQCKQTNKQPIFFHMTLLTVEGIFFFLWKNLNVNHSN